MGEGAGADTTEVVLLADVGEFDGDIFVSHSCLLPIYLFNDTLYPH